MIGNLKPYSAYKDSGVPWLGEVPEHWDVLPSRALFFEIKDRNHPDEEMLSVTISKGVVRQSNLLSNTSKKDSSNEDKTKYKLVRPGDIAYNKMRAWQGAVGASKFFGIVSPAYIVVRPRDKHNPRFFHYLLRTPAFAKEAERWSYGITSDQWSLRPEHFKMVYCCCPPVPEQAQIATFLDHADRRIRRYIRSKQKLIKLLEEQKQVVINQAVTRGLDPNVPLKPSGIEWLGDIPAHWELKRFKFLGRVTSGQVDPRKPEHKNRILIAPNHIWSRSGEIRYIETAEEQGADSGKYEVRKGEIIYSKIRPNLRKATIAHFDCLCSADMYPIKVRENEIKAGYFLRILLSEPFTRYAIDCSMRVAMPKLNREALGECWIWYPDLKEQEEILTSIDSSIKPFLAVIEHAQREIDLLQEFRTRLITDVVTGKLDVREAAAHLPAEPDNLEPLEDDLPDPALDPDADSDLDAVVEDEAA
ncbi:MAG: restriction endonuclease subunit S [Nodosilinea sp.]